MTMEIKVVIVAEATAVVMVEDGGGQGHHEPSTNEKISCIAQSTVNIITQ